MAENHCMSTADRQVSNAVYLKLYLLNVFLLIERKCFVLHAFIINWHKTFYRVKFSMAQTSAEQNLIALC